MKLKIIIIVLSMYSIINSIDNTKQTKVYEKNTTLNELIFSDFDWHLYIENNNLHHLKTETDAIEHYQKIGFFKKLDYCKKCTILILLDLYDLNLVDECINRINNLIRLNNLHTYILKINIPITNQFLDFHHAIIDKKVEKIDKTLAYNEITNLTHYHKDIITENNASTLYALSEYLMKSIEIDENNIEVICSEPHAGEIGGFFLLLDQVIKQNIEHDFIIKLHTLAHENARNMLTSFLNVKLNKALNNFEALYSNEAFFNIKNEIPENKNKLEQILSSFNIAPKNIVSFCNGGIFVVSKKFTNFFRDYDLLKLRNSLPKSDTNSDNNVTYLYERFFGCLIDHLNLTALILDHHSFQYKYDNTVGINSSIPLEYDLNEVKKLIKKNNIEVMAYYFPQFHEFEENNKLWGKGFTEWTMMNKFKGEIKRPHIDIGQYNMLDYSTRKKQASIAKKHGIDAFCYYHYWFTDKKVMYQGVEKMLEDGEPNLPFVFCWANEPWTRNWDGTTREVLIDQKYGSSESWKKHFEYLLTFFKHQNYIKEDNCPLFFIYKIEHISQNNALDMFKLWKKMAKEHGFNGLKVIAILGMNRQHTNLDNYIDGFAEHQPTHVGHNQLERVNINNQIWLDAQDMHKKIALSNRLNQPYHRGVFYSFDNGSRRVGIAYTKCAKLSYNSFENLVVNTVLNIEISPNAGKNFVMLNSWNEWTEQAMVEPNDVDGYRLLQILKKIFR